ncbi:MAG: DNA alkylation repair protein [Sphingobium sp.]|nr:DNA alkylation repair protein [Sphingobium sp.]
MATLPELLHARLADVAEPERAPAMQAYMKSAMPYFGIPNTPRTAVCKALFRDLAWQDAAAWQADVLEIWRGAHFREERYCAIDLTGVRAARAFQRMDALPMYEEMIVSGAWWDYVDAIATSRLWPILQADKPKMKAAMLDWARGEDMWKRRSAILCQLPAKGETDRHFLMACIKPSLGSKEFFLRKGIGWALRHFARTDPDWVRAYVADNEAMLSPLSKREALKHLG